MPIELLLTNGSKEIIYKKKIKEKNQLNCKKNIVNSFAKYISIDKWINGNFFLTKKKEDQTKLNCENKYC